MISQRQTSVSTNNSPSQDYTNPDDQKTTNISLNQQQNQNIRLLGVNIDCQLTFKEHISEISKKASQRVGSIDEVA